MLRAPLVEAEPLVVGEEERLVLEDGAAERGAELVGVVGRLGLREVALRVQRVVAQVVEDASRGSRSCPSGW